MGLRFAQRPQQILGRARFTVEGDAAAGGGLEQGQVHTRIPDADAHLTGAGVGGDREQARRPDVALGGVAGLLAGIDHGLKTVHHCRLQRHHQLILQSCTDDGAHDGLGHRHLHVARDHIHLLLEAALDQRRVEQFHLALEGLHPIGHIRPIHGAVALAHLVLHPGRIALAGLLLSHDGGQGAGGGARAGLVLQGLELGHQAGYGGPVALELGEREQGSDVAAHRRRILNVELREVVAQVLLQRVGQGQHLGAGGLQVLAGQLVELDHAARQLLGGGDHLALTGVRPTRCGVDQRAGLGGQRGRCSQ